MQNECANCPDIHKHDIRLTKLEERTDIMREDINEVKTELKEISEDIKQSRLYTISTLVGVIVAIGLMVFQMSVGG